MSRKYYVWKDPACGGKNIEWQVLSGAEFYTMMQLPENKGRRFIPFVDEGQEENDTIYIEATKEQYSHWHKENNAYLYRRMINQPFATVSISCPISDEEGLSLSETMSDSSVNTEDEAIKHLQIMAARDALKKLNRKDRWLLEQIYVEHRSTIDVSIELGVSQPAVYKRVNRLLKKIKKFFEETGL